MLAAMTASAVAQVPYAVLSNNNKVLTFYYDNQKTKRNGMNVGPFDVINGDYPSWFNQRKSITSVVFDASFAGCNTLTSTAYWFYQLSYLSSIKGISNLKTDNVTNMRYMFSNCSGLTSLDVSGFKTDKVTDMAGMFMWCSGLTSLDLSGFKTDNVEYMIQMFRDCSSLTTIYSGDGWSTAKVQEGTDMFTGCTSLVGGAGTRYDESYTDYTYARIDGGSDNPGYFTAKAGDTGISTVKAAADKDVWYDLNGRRLLGEPTMKGVFIKNGKKVVIK